jgi:hypothetical protein
VESATFGLARESDNEVRYSKFHIYVEGLDEWLGVTGFDIQTPGQTTSGVSLSLTYSSPEKIEFKLDDGTTLTFRFQVEGGPRLPTSFALTQTAYLTVEPPEDIGLERVQTLITRLVNFFGFAIDRTVTMTSLQVNVANWATSDTGDPNRSKRVYYPSLPTSNEIPKVRAREMLFRFSDIKSNLPILFKSWLTHYETLRAPFELYFAARGRRYGVIETRFLFVVQALESLHRKTNPEATEIPPDDFDKRVLQLFFVCPRPLQKWLCRKLGFANQLDLQARLTQLIAPFKAHFGDGPATDKLIELTRDTRNYFTHFDENPESEVAKDRLLLVLCEKLECLVQLQFLSRLGLTDKIDNIVKTNHRIRSALQEPLVP